MEKYQATHARFGVQAAAGPLKEAKEFIVRAETTRCEATVLSLGIEYLGDKMKLKTEISKEMKRFVAVVKPYTEEFAKAPDLLVPAVATRAADAIKFKDR